MAGGMSKMAKQELQATIRDRYRTSFRKTRVGSLTSSRCLPHETSPPDS